MLISFEKKKRPFSLLKMRKELSQNLTFFEREGSDRDQTQLIQSFQKLKKRPFLLGLHGTPGAGKSTFLEHFLGHVKTLKKQLICFLVDPSHPSHGGAVLGDRIRLQDHYLDPSIYIRSLSNKGDIGGTHPQIELLLMLACHFDVDYIWSESVGGGQSSTESFELFDFNLLIYDPFSGDHIQHLKSGTLDLADCILITKADQLDTRSIEQSLRESLSRDIPIQSSDLSSVDSGQKAVEAILSLLGPKRQQRLERSFLKKKICQAFSKKVESKLSSESDISVFIEQSTDQMIEEILKS